MTRTYQFHTESETVMGDLQTPVGLYLKLRDVYPCSALLESSDFHGNENSLSYIALAPIAQFSVNANQCVMTFPDHNRESLPIADGQGISQALSGFLARFKVEGADRQVCGLFGYTAFDAVRYLEPVPVIESHHEENDAPRMVKSPWFDEAVPFDKAAETGTRKVIREHSTIGVVVTTDGSVSGIPRAGYEKAEARVIAELEELGKPYVILLNSTHPADPETARLAVALEAQYGRAVLPVSCAELDAAALEAILESVLYEFPVRELDFAIPRWVTMLDSGHWLQSSVYQAALDFAAKVSRMRDLRALQAADALACEAVARSPVTGMDLAEGSVRVTVELKPEVFYQVLSEQTGLEIGDEAGLMPCIIELAQAKRAYERLRGALEQVEATGYGIVMPTIGELQLEQPEIVQQGGRYGVRLQASAPSLHIMRAVIRTELNPIVGSERQSRELAESLLASFADDPVKLWESNLFGKSLHQLVNEGLQAKLLHMPQEARTKMQETLERVINEGCTGLICILL